MGKNQDHSGGATIPEVPIYKLGGDKIKTKENLYELTPEIHKDRSSTGYSAKTIRDDNDFLTLHNVLRDVGHTGDGDRSSKRGTFFTKGLLIKLQRMKLNCSTKFSLIIHKAQV